jgi:hypothetical protein
MELAVHFRPADMPRGWFGPWAAMAAACLAASAADVHVSPAGDDAADGSAGKPVATLRRALDRVREIRGADRDRGMPVVIEVADGRYELPAPIVVTPEDSGTEAAPTVVRAAAGARPVFSGGRSIRGWRVSGAGDQARWNVDLPEVKAGTWNFCQLFVNDGRRFRPILPASGWHTIAGTLDPSPAAAGKGHDRFVFSGDDLRSDWANLDDVEVVAVHRWTMSRLPIAKIAPLDADPARRAVTFAGHTRGLREWCSFPAGNGFFVENVREALGSAGTWYLDRPTGTLTYCPFPGESPDTAVVIAPVAERLLEFRGDATAGRTVEHVRLEGLTFAHDNWTMPRGGQSYPQAEVVVGGAIVATAGRHLVFDRCVVRQVGRYAIEFRDGCRDCTVVRCELVDLGGGGVLASSRVQQATATLTGTRGVVEPEGHAVTGIVVRDTTIAHGGRLHPAAVGVWIGHASHCTVEHCDIHDLTYTGVSVGWTWGYAPSPARHNRVARNHIYDIGHGVLSDMGGIYTLGISPGTVVEDNVIHDIVGRDYGGWGLYTDEGSTGVVMRRNLVYRTSSGGFHQHYGRDNAIESNVFALARDCQLKRSKVEDHTSFRFERNIVWWNSPQPLVEGDWTRQLVTRSNCYWNASGPVVFPDGKNLASRQAAGQDAGSIVADPKFVDPDHGDFTLAADSPVRALGFEPLDPAAAGRRTPRSLTATMTDVPTAWPESRARPKAATEPGIERFLTAYFRDWSAGDMAAYRAHFDDSARIAFIRDGRVEWCQELDAFIREQDRILRAAEGTMRERMTSFTAENDAATALVTARWELTHRDGSTFGVDRFTLVRDPAGRWKIAALAFYHTDR